MLQHKIPDDFVVSTGETHTVREWIESVFSYAGIDLEWHGEGIKEVGRDRETKKTIVFIDARLYRPHEVNYLLGDSSKASRELGWSPKIGFKELARIMFESDLKFAQKEQYIKNYKEKE
jgi:GDPmannose 4,6-dehydratase